MTEQKTALVWGTGAGACYVQGALSSLNTQQGANEGCWYKAKRLGGCKSV